MSDVLLDLVRQYGNEQANIVGAMEMAGPDQVQEHEQAAEALFARIAALIPQQPAQARDNDGEALWIHACGKVVGWSAGGPPPDWACDNDTSTWRPLLVGGDPAPEQPSVPGSTIGPHRYERGPYAVDGAQVCGLCGERRAAAIHRSEQSPAYWQRVAANYRETCDSIAAALDLPADGSAELLVEVQKVIDERDAARTQRDQVVDNSAAWQAQYDEARAEIAKLKGEIKMFTDVFGAQPAEPGPLRLTLPEVPPGTVGLVGRTTGHRWTPTEFGRWVDEVTGQVRGILPHLEREGSVTVELAPPREPRTWPKLTHDIADAALPDVVDVATNAGPARWVLVTDDGLYTGPLGGRKTLIELRALGDVTEVLDEPGATT